MKEELLLICVSIFVVAVFVSALYWLNPVYDEECLKEAAREYCASINYTLDEFKPILSDFICENARDLRRYDSKSFNYLPEEKAQCLLKEAYTFKSKGDNYGSG